MNYRTGTCDSKSLCQLLLLCKYHVDWYSGVILIANELTHHSHSFTMGIIGCVIGLFALAGPPTLGFVIPNESGRTPVARIRLKRTPTSLSAASPIISTSSIAATAHHYNASEAVAQKYYGVSPSAPILFHQQHQEPPFKRATEIGSIVTCGVLAPLIVSLVQGALVDNDWNEFWKQTTGVGTIMTNAERVTAAMEQLGPTFCKFGQALSTRPDIVPPALADAFSVLQDDMQPFDSDAAHEIIKTEVGDCSGCLLSIGELETFMDSLSVIPVAAASIGQVYKGVLPGYGPVAVKVQRPGVTQMVAADTTLLKSVATWIESLPGLPGQQQRKLVAAKLTQAVDEFMSRVTEELDYRNEVANMKTFSRLYSRKGGSSKYVQVVVPEVYEDFCTKHVIVMEWIEGTKLNGESATEEEERDNLALVSKGIDCTLSQLLDTGILHADSHPGNLLKVQTDDGVQLGYLDFGILATVPESVRDGLVCAVAYLVFARDVEAVAHLFGELQLLPQYVLRDKEEHAALTEALNRTFTEVLQYPDCDSSGLSGVPTLRFDKLLGSLSGLVTRFQFQLPKYFLNNARCVFPFDFILFEREPWRGSRQFPSLTFSVFRCFFSYNRALGTLEGLARSLDPSFNVLRVVYPYALNRLLNNPSVSHAVEETLMQLVRSPETGRFDRRRLSKLIDDSAVSTGHKRRKVVFDIVKSRGGLRMIRKITTETIRYGRVGRGFRRGFRKAIFYFRL